MDSLSIHARTRAHAPPIRYQHRNRYWYRFVPGAAAPRMNPVALRAQATHAWYDMLRAQVTHVPRRATRTGDPHACHDVLRAQTTHWSHSRYDDVLCARAAISGP
jgi:hypothetical protein